MENWLKKETSCELTPTITSVTHIETETAQNETKQTEAAPDDSSASAREKDDRQNDGNTSAFLDLRGPSFRGVWGGAPPRLWACGSWGEVAGGSWTGRELLLYLI